MRRFLGCIDGTGLIRAAGVVVVVLLATPFPVSADAPTPGANPSPEPTVRAIPTAAPTATRTSVPRAAPTSKPRPRPKPTVIRVKVKRPVRHTIRHKRARPVVHSTRPPAVKVEHRGKKPAHRPRSTPVPARPAPTPPPLSLSTDNSISPITCNGPAKPMAPRPFLLAPYHRWNSLISYFDHDLPSFSQDGLIVTTTGLRVQPDATHHAWDFPAYWSTALRQYIYYDGHNGYDYSLSYEPVYAAAAGTVIFSAFEYPTMQAHGYGQMVLIDHHNGYVTLYGHFSKLLVHAGQHVRAGQEIGISGNTGHSTGPHLHFTVFHNCSPVDPYGWAGPGADPLAAYQGETSEYLWKAPPLLVNPPPGIPGIDALPGLPSFRLILLHLPPTSGGTQSFSAALRREANAVRRTLGAGVARLDLVRGAVDLYAPIRPARIYALPEVASIATASEGGDARTDLLAALAQAGLGKPARSLVIKRSPNWTGYLMHLGKTTVLVGKGERGGAIKLRLAAGGHRAAVQEVQANRSTGAYAVSLGVLSRTQLRALTDELSGRKHDGPLTFQRVESRPAQRSGTAPGSMIVLFLVLAALGAAAVGLGWKNRRPAAH